MQVVNLYLYLARIPEFRREFLRVYRCGRVAPEANARPAILVRVSRADGMSLSYEIVYSDRERERQRVRSRSRSQHPNRDATCYSWGWILLQMVNGRTNNEWNIYR